MGTALKMHLEARTAPVIAALAAVAAGTLIATTILGQSLGPIPIDNPAIALIPGSGADAPLILSIPSQPALPPEPAGVLTAQQPVSIPAAAADELVPNRSRTGVLIVSAPPEPRAHPAPNQTLVEEIRRRVSEITEPLYEHVEVPRSAGRAIAAAPTPHGMNDENNKGRRPTEEAVARTSADASAQAGPLVAAHALAVIASEVPVTGERMPEDLGGPQSKSGALSSGPQSKSEVVERAGKPEETTEPEA